MDALKKIHAIAEEHLKNAGLKEGAVVMDIGCGNGVMTCFMAEKVGPSGHVYAVDMSQDQLDLTKRRAEEFGLTNISFIKADINSTENLPKEVADLAYVRFVLMHMRRPDQGISTIKHVLKPGGKAASMESILESFYKDSKTAIIKNYYNALIKLGEHCSVDYNTGKKLKELYEDAGFSNVEYDIKYLPLSFKDGKKFLLLSIGEWGDKAIDAGTASVDEIEQIKKSISDIEDGSEDFFYPASGLAIATK